jgi:membrane fusion protein (multidrug efflux system)
MLKRFSYRRNIPKALLLMLACAFLSSCTNQSTEPSQNPVVDVDVMELKPTTSFIEKKYPGSIEGTVNVDIKAQVIGYLEEIYVKEGDYVQKGQSLFRIKGDVYHEQVKNTQAALKVAQAAEEAARLELEKIKPLVAGKVVSEIQLQTAEANYASAKAQVAQASANVGSSQINAAFSLIKAPVSGYIGRIPNRIGNLVTPNDVMPLTSLSEINQVFVYFSLSEGEYISFMKDRKNDASSNMVELVMADGTIYEQKGRLEIASGNIDRLTGSIPLKAVFPNPDKILRSGGSAKVIVKKKIDLSLIIPMASVRDIQDRYFAFVLGDSNKVDMKPFTISGSSDNNYIIKSGLKEGEKVVLNRIDILNQGTKVVPVMMESSNK